MAAEWMDISVMLKSGMVHWPGDPGVKVKPVHAMAQGADANVSHLSMGSHTGTHMDAPFHFISSGKGIDQLPIDATVGQARVIAIKNRRSINVDELITHNIRRGERVLFKTYNSQRCWKSDIFFKDFVYISAAAAKFLAQRKIRSVGVDYLSVGGFHKDDDGLKTHQALLKAGIWIIEGLNLSRVKPGEYALICLPLKLSHGDGAPARAILRPLKKKKI